MKKTLVKATTHLTPTPKEGSTGTPLGNQSTLTNLPITEITQASSPSPSTSYSTPIYNDVPVSAETKPLSPVDSNTDLYQGRTDSLRPVVSIRDRVNAYPYTNTEPQPDLKLVPYRIPNESTNNNPQITAAAKASIHPVTSKIKPEINDSVDTSQVIIDDRHKNIIEVLEVNSVKRFQSLAHKGVILGTYQAMKERYGHPSTDSMQMRPDKWKPPVLLNKTFDESHLKPEIVALLRQGDVEIQHISDELYVLQIPETSSLPQDALDLFEGSFLQDLLKND
jgi:hypothetical protein